MSHYLQILLQTGPVAKFVLVVLAILSTLSWAVIFMKIHTFRQSNRESEDFMRLLRNRTAWPQLYKTARSLRNGPLPRLFVRACIEFDQWKKRPASGPDKSSREEIILAMKTAQIEEIGRLDSRLSLLASTTSVSPLLGLFGTVWGVMDAFVSIGLKGSADLATVGPGIAEALITTAVGLAVAIPSLTAYNAFAAIIRKWEDRLDGFSAEIAVLLDRERPE
jgi:biopolymer transport protein TolQ